MKTLNLTSFIAGVISISLLPGCALQGILTEDISIDQIPKGTYNAQKTVDEHEGIFAYLLDKEGGLGGELIEPLQGKGRKSLEKVLKDFEQNNITNLLVERIKDKKGQTQGYLVGDVEGFLVYLNENKGKYIVKLEMTLPKSEDSPSSDGDDS